MAVDLYPYRAYGPDDQPAFAGLDVKLVTSGTEAFVCQNDPAGAPRVVEHLTGVWASRVHGRWALADVATSEVRYTFVEGAGCGCGDPMKLFDPRVRPVTE